MVRIPYESRAIHGPKQNRQKASHGQKNGARVVSRSGERSVRIHMDLHHLPDFSFQFSVRFFGLSPQN